MRTISKQLVWMGAVSLFVWGSGAFSTAWAKTPPISETRLPNGQMLYIEENHTQPIVTIDTWVATGSVNEDEEDNGVSHFLEHLLFKGTPTHPVGIFERTLEAKGGQFNAATSDDYTHYHITIASPFFEEALKLHSDMMLNAAIPPEELDRERKVVQEEINRAEDNPHRKLFKALGENLYGSHSYAFETLGPKELIGTIPRQSILDYYHYWYRPEHMKTIVVGDVNPEQVTRLVNQAFAENPLQKSNYSPPTYPKPQALSAPKVQIVSDPSTHQAYVALAFLGPSIEERNDTYALDVAMQVLGQGKSSRLYKTLREDQALVQGVEAGNMTQKQSGLVYVLAEAEPDNLQSVLDVTLQQLQEAKAHGITPEELEKTKTQFVKDFVFHNETTDDVAETVGYNVTIGNLSDYTEYLDHIQQVTLAEVQRVLNQYLDFRHAAYVAVIPASPPPDAKASTVTEKSTDSPVAPAADTLKQATLKQLETAIALQESPATLAQTVPESKTPQIVSQASGIEKTQLKNGMTLVMKPWKEAETVTLNVLVKGGQLVEPIPGTADLLAQVMLKGTTHRNAEDLNRELESRGMHLSVAAQADYMQVTASCVKEDLGELFLVLADVLSAPRLDPGDIDKEKRLMQQALESARDNPFSLAFENLQLAMYPDHPYGNVGRRIEDHLDDLQQEDLGHYFRQWVVPRNMVVTAVGNFDPRVLTDTLEASFPEATASSNSSWKTDSPMARAQDVEPLSKNRFVEEAKPEQAATWVAQGWLTPAIASADYVPLKVMNTLLGTGMSSRLFMGLREKQGLAYVVGSLYPSRAGDSHFVLYIGTDPKNREKVLEGFSQQVKALQTTPISEQELTEAKDKLIGNFALEHETPAQQAFYLGLYEILGMGYQYDTQYPDLVRKVTSADIQRVAAYLGGPSVLSLVVPKPEETAPHAGSQ